MAKRQALGKGLNALLTNTETDITGKNPIPLNTVSEINISDIEANPFQPRENFSEDELEELVDSIKLHGIIQPVTVRKIGYGKYQLISGERRTRASIRAGLKKIPAYVRVADDQAMLELSLIENIHRENLNAIEVAISYQRLIDECKLRQEDVAQRIGKNRSTVTNYLRLLKLPDELQIALRDGKITMGHARALITIDDKALQLHLLQKILEEGLSVRDTELMAQNKKLSKSGAKKARQKKELSEENQKWEQKLSSSYNSKVRIKSLAGGKGQIIINFKNADEFKRITALLSE